MNQRGVTRELIDLVLDQGRWEGDRCVLDRKGVQRLIEKYDRLRKLAVRVLDKGGLVVVESGGAEITTYPLRKRRRKGRR